MARRDWTSDPEGIAGEELLSFVNGTLFPALKELPSGSHPRANIVRSVFRDTYNYMKSCQLMRQVVKKINGNDFNDLAKHRYIDDIHKQMLNDLRSVGNTGEYYTPRAVTSFMIRTINPKPGETLLDPACDPGGLLILPSATCGSVT